MRTPARVHFWLPCSNIKNAPETKAGDQKADLVAEELQLLRALDETGEHQIQLLARKHTQEEKDKLSQQIRELNLKYQDVRAKLKEQEPRHATLIHTNELTADQLQKIVGDNETLLLEFALGERQSYVWVISRTAITSFELPDRSTIEALVRGVYELATLRQSADAQHQISKRSSKRIPITGARHTTQHDAARSCRRRAWCKAAPDRS